MNQKILSIVQLISHSKSLSKEKIFEALEHAISIATKQRYNQKIYIRVSINRDSGSFDTFRRWKVVKQVICPTKEITIEAAKFENKNVQLQDFIEDQIQSINFDRVTTQIAKRIIIKKVREVKKLITVEKFCGKKGQLVNCIVKKVNYDHIILDLRNNIEGVILNQNILPQEKFKIGDYIRGILYEIHFQAKNMQLFISRTKAEMLLELFRIEVPEINEKVVEIKSIARDAGFRSKIAVYTKHRYVDPVGACIGMRGARVNSISAEMCGERIDIILWDDNPAQFIVNAMAPVNVDSIIIHSEIHAMDVIVETHNLARAIGKYGRNVKLASRLSGWELNILTVDDIQYNTVQKKEKIRNFLKRRLNLNNYIINVLVRSEFFVLKELSCTPHFLLLKIPGMNKKIAHLIQDASDLYLSNNLLKKKFLSGSCTPSFYVQSSTINFSIY